MINEIAKDAEMSKGISLAHVDSVFSTCSLQEGELGNDQQRAFFRPEEMGSIDQETNKKETGPVCDPRRDLGHGRDALLRDPAWHVCRT